MVGVRNHHIILGSPKNVTSLGELMINLDEQPLFYLGSMQIAGRINDACHKMRIHYNMNIMLTEIGVV